MDLKQVGRRRVITVAAEAPMEEAARIMRDAHVGDVIVVDERKTPIGILTDRDIVVGMIALGASVDAFAVGDLMTTSLVTVGEHEPLSRVIELMKENGVKRIPITGAAHELVGIVTIEDVMAALAGEFNALAEVAGRQRKFEILKRRKLA